MAEKYQLGTAQVFGEETAVFDVGGQLFPLSVLGTARELPASIAKILDDWTAWGPEIGAAVDRFRAAGTRPPALPPGGIRWLPPILYPRKLVCLGENYSDHVDEMKFAPLKLPYAFLKPPTTTLAGAGSDVPLLKESRMNDWEVELAVVVGRRAKDVAEDAALGVVAGYAVLNDVSARDWIAEKPELGIDWVMQKASDGYAPMGPMITPAEFVPDPQSLDLELTINGRVMQRANTSMMVFSVRQIIAHLSKFVTLEPGDVIATGTPSGTGFGHKPQVFLRPGDVARATISGLGTLENRFV